MENLPDMHMARVVLNREQIIYYLVHCPESESFRTNPLTLNGLTTNMLRGRLVNLVKNAFMDQKLDSVRERSLEMSFEEEKYD